MPLPSPIPEELAIVIGEQFRVLGDPTRIRLLDHLREGAASVGELRGVLGTSQQNASKHLGILHAAGIVSRRKEGTSVRYAIADASVFELCELVCGRVRRQLDERAEVLVGVGPATPTTKGDA